VVERARLVLLEEDRSRVPRFVYHAARELELESARRLVRDAEACALDGARAALAVTLERLAAAGCEVVVGGLLASRRPLPSSLETILASHALLHAAEGALFRAAMRGACEALDIPVRELEADELEARAAAVLAIPSRSLPSNLTAIGRTAGKPWNEDFRQACLTALAAQAPPDGLGKKAGPGR
jgi:hypothetical protein